MSLDRQKIRIAEHIEVSWATDEFDAANCPNCGATQQARRLLAIDYQPPGQNYTYTINTCVRCGARFFDNTEIMDYGTAELIEMGWHIYQIQAGAGLWPIAAALSRIDKPPGALALEIGGAYGFGLDFAIRARQWTGIGYDPSPLAAFGANELGLITKQDYFTEQDLTDSPYDVIIATEVIEHLPSPPAFLRLMCRALAPDGVLMLTTPDGEKITPGLNTGELLPMLSPGAHLVLQTAASLELVLVEAGFAHVKVLHSGLSLIAYASASEFGLAGDPASSRAMYRQYLLERSRTARNSDLLFGFAGRAMFEAVNDQDFATAEAAWETLQPPARACFGIDLGRIAALPEGAAQASLATLAKLIPLGLGMILYSRAIQQLSQGVPRAALLPLFRLSAAALDCLQAALARRSLTDGLAASLRGAVETEIVLCRADAGDPGCVAAVIALLERDPGHIVTAWRVFITLVNAARYAEALKLQQAAQLYAPYDGLADDLGQDAILTAGILSRHEEARLREDSWRAYQIQLGIGLWSIAGSLAQINKPAGARLLEIGGGYGFGLDFCTRARHWAGIGYDPSPLAAFGANELGLNTKQDYFTEAELVHARYDVVIATEVIEHLPDPPAFLRLMLRALASDGVLMLTTPDGEKITADLSAGELLPMLSPGPHLVLQTAASLRLVLLEAGFHHVQIVRSGLSLIAYASRSQFELSCDPAGSRAMYRRYLLERCGTTGNSDLLFGFAGRAMFEAVNDRDFAAAEMAWKTLLPPARQRFGIDLNGITSMPEGAGQASLATLVERMPLGLGMILYSRAMQLLLQGIGRAELLPLFRLSAAALDALQAALGRRSLRDGLSAKLRDAVETEIMLCLADDRDPGCIAAVLKLAREDEKHIVTAWRVFISLVNAGYFPEARALQQAAQLFVPHDELAEDLRQNALFTLAVLALQEEPDWPRAVKDFAQLRVELLESMQPHGEPHHLFWPALRGEVLALINLNRKNESVVLLQKFLPAYPGAPDDLRLQIPSVETDIPEALHSS